MTMWNEADDWDCQRIEFGAGYSHQYSRYGLPIDNPKSVDHDIYQRAVNRCVGSFVGVLTLAQIALTDSWLAAIAAAVWLAAGTIATLVVTWMVAAGLPELWDWLMGE